MSSGAISLTGLGEPAVDDEPFLCTVHVPYFQVDQQGVVNHMWYLAWCDEAYTAYLEHLGLSYPVLVESGHDQHIVNVNLDWVGAVRPDDTRVAVAVSELRVGDSSFTLRYVIAACRPAGPVDVAHGRITYVNVVDGRSTALPQQLRMALESDRGIAVD